MRRRFAMLLLLLAVLLAAGCGEKPERGSAAAQGEVVPFRVMLDYFPNADHAGLYAARDAGYYREAGLDVALTPPPDPAAPLKLLLAGRTDLAISYEPEVLLAADRGADLVVVGALVQKPLTAVMAVGGRVRSVRDLAGRRVGTAGLPYQSAYLRTILTEAGVDPGSVRETSVGFNLVPAMLSGKVDATLGAFWNYEGTQLARQKRDPTVLRMEELGVPTYAELVLVARRRDLDQNFGARVRRFLSASARGHTALRADPAGRLRGLLQADRGLDRGLQEAVVRATLPVFFPARRDRPWGYQDVAEWQTYADWMLGAKLIRRRLDAGRVLTNEFLPGEGLDPRDGIDQD